jgi:RNA polymerase sigma factor (sigma-70 family)
MTAKGLPQRLSSISTHWCLLQQAHTGQEEAAAAARQWLLQRYDRPVRAYLLAALHDPHAADDLAQEFGLSLLRGEFHRANPQCGRFRNYVKTVLFHLVCNYRKRRQKEGLRLSPDHPNFADLAAPSENLDRQFNETWREELLARVWQALAEADSEALTVLRIRKAHPKMSSLELAEELGRQLLKPFSAVAARQKLHRARELMGDLLLDEVAQSLAEPTEERLLEELRDLDLLRYCQPALERYRHGRRGKKKG